MLSPEFIVIHHSLTADSGTVSWGAIRKHHTDPAGPYKMRDVGYHWGLELVGDFYEILVGRTMQEEGAHCKDAQMNRRGVGVCCVGDFDKAPPPEAQLAALVRLVKWLMADLNIPQEHVIGHRDAGLMAGFDWRRGQYKTCPGRLFDTDAFQKRLPPFTRSVAGGATGPVGTESAGGSS